MVIRILLFFFVTYSLVHSQEIPSTSSWEIDFSLLYMGSVDSSTENGFDQDGWIFRNYGNSYFTGFGPIIMTTWRKDFPDEQSPVSLTAEISLRGGKNVDSVGVIATLGDSTGFYEMPEGVHVLVFSTRWKTLEWDFSRLKSFSRVYLSFITWAPDTSLPTGSEVLVRNLRYIDSSGVSHLLDFSPLTGVEGNAEVSEDFALEQNYPNPFNPSTTIRFAVPNTGPVSLKVLNLLGQEVATLVDEVKAPGNFEAVFDASKFPSGIYFYRLRAGEYVEIRKMVLLR